MKNKVCLVTGATAGIGKVTARVLAEQGAKVIIVGRNKEKCIQTTNEIRELTKNPSVEYILSDLSKQKDVKKLAEQFKNKYDRLDVLINNAGVNRYRREETVDGIEVNFAVNHLAPFLLTNLLLEVIKTSAPARIINVSSSGHSGKSINFDDIQSKTNYNGMDVYGKSKLANLLFTYELARRLEGTDVTVNAVHPGVVATDIASNYGGIFKYLLKIIKLFVLNVEQGAKPSIFLATSPDVKNITGKYYSKMKMAPSSKESYNEEDAKRLWEISSKITGIK